tara:strand:- start:45 stop:638 length:594 start_codon:yes stop_codon:yes gene_type:complete
MSTIKGTSFQHASASSANIVLDNTGKVSIAEKKLYCPGTIIQVLQTVKTDTANYGTASWADVSGMSQVITPTAVTSKFKVSVDARIGAASYTASIHLRLVRTVGGSDTVIGVGDAASNRTQGFWGTEEFGRESSPPYQVRSVSTCYLDDPDTTSAITYKLQWNAQQSTAYINQTGDDTDAAQYPRCSSAIMVEEVAG